MNQDIIKKLPFSMLAEQALLGSILIDPPALTQISDTVRAEDFHLQEHRQIYQAMKQLSLLNHDIDRRKMVLDHPIRSYGSYTVDAKLYTEVVAKINVLVCKK